MSKIRKKKELVFEVIEDRKMPQERQEAVVEMLTEWMWRHLEADLKPPSSTGVGCEEESQRLKDEASG